MNNFELPQSNVKENVREPNATLLKLKLNDLEIQLKLYKLHREIMYEPDVNYELVATTPYSIKNSLSKHSPNSVITREGNNLSMSRASLDTNFNQMWYLDQTKDDNSALIKSYRDDNCLSSENNDSIKISKCDPANIKQKWYPEHTGNKEIREYKIFDSIEKNKKCITIGGPDGLTETIDNTIKLGNECDNATSKWLIYPSDLPMLMEKINELARESNDLIKIITSKGDRYQAAIDMNVTQLLIKNEELQTAHAKLLETPDETMKVNAKFELTKITTDSNYSNYILYLIFMIFIVGCLIYIFKNPEGNNLDIFILVLAGLIFVYYVYDYYKKLQRK